MGTQTAAQVHNTRKAKKNPTKQVVAKSRAAVQIARAVRRAMPVSAPATAPPEVRPAAVKKGPRLVGNKSGLSKRAFYVQTLKENEKFKLTDAELQNTFDKEFPGTVSYKVSAIRAKLNRGGFGEVGFESKAYGEPSKKKATPAKPAPVPEKKFVAKKAVPTIWIPETAPAATGQVAEAKEGGQ